jgi:hypothetical protein
VRREECGGESMGGGGKEKDTEGEQNQNMLHVCV